MFAGLQGPELEVLAGTARMVRVRAGDLVYQRGDPARSLAVVRTGRLEVLTGADDEAVVTELTAGAVLGELGLLSEGTRSSSVRAVRDTELIEIGATAFSALLEANPELALTLARTLAVRLQGSRDLSPPTVRISVITVVALIRDPDRSTIVDLLTAVLAQATRVERIEQIEPRGSPATSGAPGTEPAERLHAAERGGGLGLLVVGDLAADPDWTDFCLRSADRVVLLTAADPHSSSVKGDDRLRGCDLVFVGPTPSSHVTDLLSALQPRAHHFVPDASSADHIGRLARRITGRAIGLVLSGGGARGLGHVGALAALEAAGVVIDRIGGTSMGALVGAMAAGGWSPVRTRSALEQELVRRHPFNDFTVPRRSVIRGQKAMAMLERLLGAGTVEQLDLPYFAVSADLSTGERVVHRRGSLSRAVAATMAVPGLTPPVEIDGRLLVDGGVIDNLPVDVMAVEAEGPVIAIDVMRHADHHVGSRTPRQGGAGRGSPSIVETLVRASLLGSWERTESSRKEADLVVTPAVQDIGLLAFDRIEDAVEAGSSAMSDALRSAEFARISSLVSRPA